MDCSICCEKFNKSTRFKIECKTCPDINIQACRDCCKKYLLDNGIQTLIHYPIPIHKQKAYEEYENLNLPLTEQIHQEVLSLPIGEHISNMDLSYVVKVVNEFEV